MTVAAQNPTISYVEDGTTTSFAVPFRYDDPADLRALRRAADGTETQLVNGANFTASSGATNAGGTLTVAVAGTVGTELEIYRETERSQQNDYITNGAFTAESHEKALDKGALIDQEQDAEIARTLRFPRGEAGPVLPSVTDRISKIFAFNASGAVGLLTASALAAALVAPLTALLPISLKGDPGSPGEGYSTRAALQEAANSATAADDFYLTEEGRVGRFVYRTGDFTTEIAADPRGALFLATEDDPTGASGCLVRAYEGDPQLSWWGVTGDGTDESADVQAAVDTIHAFRLGKLQIGSMQVSCANIAIKSDVRIVGVSWFHSVFNPALDAPVLVIEQDKSVVRIGFENFSIIGDTSLVNQSGIVIDPNGAGGWFCDTIHFDRVRVIECGKRGIDLQGGDSTSAGFVQQVAMRDVKVQRCMAAGLYAQGVVIESVSDNCWFNQNNQAENTPGAESRADEANAVLIAASGASTRVPRAWAWRGGTFSGQVVGTGESEVSTAVYCEGQEITFDTGNIEHAKIHMRFAGSARDIVIRNYRLASSSPMEDFIKVDAVNGMLIENVTCPTSLDSSFNHVINAFSGNAIFRVVTRNVRYGGTASPTAKAFNISNRLLVNRNVASQVELTGTGKLYKLVANSGAGTAADDNELHTIAMAITGSAHSTDNFSPQDTVTFMSADPADPVTVKDGADNISLNGGDYLLDTASKSITLAWDADLSPPAFVEVART